MKQKHAPDAVTISNAKQETLPNASVQIYHLLLKRKLLSNSATMIVFAETV